MDKKECFCVTYLVDGTNEKKHFLYRDVDSKIANYLIPAPKMTMVRESFEHFLGNYAIIVYMNKDDLADKLNEIDTNIKQIPQVEKYTLVDAKIVECPKG